jgi:BirA family biotin operon repressor/biotin-[acetyl-CoA-carboxylase] ligase
MSIGCEIIRQRSVTSTMDVCESFARAGADEGLVVIADEQTAGRGRAGRIWTASPGDALLGSILLRPPVPPARLGLLPLLIGVAVAESIEAVASLQCMLKWPNDVVIETRKIAGILVQSRLIGSAVSHVIVGVGINVNAERSSLPEGATSMALECGYDFDREALLVDLLRNVDRDYSNWIDADGVFSLDRWRARSAFNGELVSVIQDDAMLEGVMDGVTDDGRLLLRLATGEVRTLSIGEIHRGPRPIEPITN